MSAFRSSASVVAEAVIAFGGNVGGEAQVRDTLDRAIAALCDGLDIQLQARSSDYRTPPWGVTDQPPFVNCVIIATTELSPPALLECAHAVERQFGRDRPREQHWGPRTLDIDLIAYDDLTRTTPTLTLPHPRALERAFVLLPLAEIAPEGRILGVRIKDALARIGHEGIEKLPPRDGTDQPL
jgi:2-amino-4-hydroxy-6-hydroxymethyldihydropteridine diphosphokinase